MEPEDDFDVQPKLVTQESFELDVVSTPPILNWLDFSLDVSPQPEVMSLIPFETLFSAVDARQLASKLQEVVWQDDFNVLPRKSNEDISSRSAVNPIVRELNRLISNGYDEMDHQTLTGEFYMLGDIYARLLESGKLS